MKKKINLIIFVLVFSLYFLTIYLLNSFQVKFSFINEKNILNLSDFNDYYKSEEDKYKALKNGQNFFNLCIKGKLINKIPNSLISSEEPLISVIIPVYNTGIKIKYVVRSAQNQNISNLEIILVNDFSNIETIKTIGELIQEDKRVKCIKICSHFINNFWY